MKKIGINLHGDDFVIHLDDENFRKTGKVYPILRHGKDWSYKSLSGGSIANDFKDARCLFSFSFCWRGVWEGRIYFEDEEFWSEELNTMKLLWDTVEIYLKGLVSDENPNAPSGSYNDNDENSVYLLIDGTSHGQQGKGVVGVFDSQDKAEKAKGDNWYTIKQMNINELI